MTKSARNWAMRKSELAPTNHQSNSDQLMKTITFDGSATTSGGGAEGYAVCNGLLEVIATGSRAPDPGNSSQRAELRGLIAALQQVPIGPTATQYLILGDSSYAISLINENRIAKWRSRGWKNSTNKTPANMDLVLQVEIEISLRPGLTVQWINRCSTDAARLVDSVSRPESIRAVANQTKPQKKS